MKNPQSRFLAVILVLIFLLSNKRITTIFRWPSLSLEAERTSEKNSIREGPPFGEIFTSRVCGNPHSRLVTQQNLRYLGKTYADDCQDFLLSRHRKSISVRGMWWASTETCTENVQWLVERWWFVV